MIVLLIPALLYQSYVDDGLRWTGWIVYPALLFPAACLISKRLHDCGRRAWWGFPVVWALFPGWAEPHGAYQFVALAILVVAAVDLGVMPGQNGANRFGPSRVEQAA